MNAHLVRRRGERKPVGIFIADALPSLTLLVAKSVAVERCEYLELPAGAVTWPQRGGTKPPSLKQAQLSGNWRKLMRAKDADWMPILTSADRAA
jgi:hypothetical protein